MLSPVVIDKSAPTFLSSTEDAAYGKKQQEASKASSGEGWANPMISLHLLFFLFKTKYVEQIILVFLNSKFVVHAINFVFLYWASLFFPYSCLEHAIECQDSRR